MSRLRDTVTLLRGRSHFVLCMKSVIFTPRKASYAAVPHMRRGPSTHRGTKWGTESGGAAPVRGKVPRIGTQRRFCAQGVHSRSVGVGWIGRPREERDCLLTTRSAAARSAAVISRSHTSFAAEAEETSRPVQASC